MRAAIRAKLLIFPARPNVITEVHMVEAYDIGYSRGLADQHFEKRTFATGPQYSAWLLGWRAGQAELKNAVWQSELNAQNREKEARGAFEGALEVLRDGGAPSEFAGGLFGDRPKKAS